jgi:hypothetical protein
MTVETEALADIQAGYGETVNATSGLPESCPLFQQTLKRIAALGGVQSIPAPLRRLQEGALPAFGAVFIEDADDREGEGEILLLSDPGGAGERIGRLPWPGRWPDASERDFRSSPLWSRLLDELAHAAGGRVVVTTCAGVGWIHKAAEEGADR